MKSDRDARAANQKAKENEESLQTVYFNVNYAKVKDLEGKVKTVLSKRPDVSLVVDERSNTIMIRDVKKSIDDAIILMAKLDTRTPQVLIESNLIETTPTFARALGFRFQFTSGGTTFSSAAGAGSPFTGNTAGAFPSPSLMVGRNAIRGSGCGWRTKKPCKRFRGGRERRKYTDNFPPVRRYIKQHCINDSQRTDIADTLAFVDKHCHRKRIFGGGRRGRDGKNSRRNYFDRNTAGFERWICLDDY